MITCELVLYTKRWHRFYLHNQAHSSFYVSFQATPRLISIFADANECPELRMAIFSLLLNSELNFATLQTVANIVKREITNPIQGPRSNQVASYVVSHLWALAYHNNVLTKKR